MAACAASSTAFATWNMSSLKAALPSVSTQTTPSVRFSIGSSSPSGFRLSSTRNPSCRPLQSFVGLAPLHPLLSLFSPGMFISNSCVFYFPDFIVCSLFMGMGILALILSFIQLILVVVYCSM